MTAGLDNRLPAIISRFLQIQPAGVNTNLVMLHDACGRGYALESSSNLATWKNYLTLPGKNGMLEVSVPTTNTTRQFLHVQEVLP